MSSANPTKEASASSSFSSSSSSFSSSLSYRHSAIKNHDDTDSITIGVHECTLGNDYFKEEFPGNHNLIWSMEVRAPEIHRVDAHFQGQELCARSVTSCV